MTPETIGLIIEKVGTVVIGVMGTLGGQHMIRVRKAKTNGADPPSKWTSDQIRYIDERAEHKARNVVGAVTLEMGLLRRDVTMLTEDVNTLAGKAGELQEKMGTIAEDCAFLRGKFGGGA